MMHKNRRFQIADVASVEELAKKLHESTWTLCTAFRIGDLLLCNDSTSPDGAQEYAVLRPSKDNDGRHKQIESLTVSWFESEEKLRETLQSIVDGEWTESSMGFYRLPLHTSKDYCSHCA